MFRRNHRAKSTPTIIDTTKKSKETKLKSKETKKLKIFKKESKEEKVVTIKINSNKKNQSRQSYTKLKSPSTLNISHIPNQNQYIISAHLQNNILTITVYHGIKSIKWRQQFTQNSFKNISIYQVSKILIRSIQQTANKTNQKKLNYKHKKKKNDNIKTKEIKIFEYNSLCYVTLIDSNLPSFALRPIYENTSSDLNGLSSQKRQRYSTPNISHSYKKRTFYPNNSMQQDEYTDYADYYRNSNRNLIRKWSNNANFNKVHNMNNINDGYRKKSDNTLISNESYGTLSYSPSPIGINSNYTPSEDTNTTVTVDDIVKGPGFIDGDYYKHKINKNKDNIKYGFV